MNPQVLDPKDIRIDYLRKKEYEASIIAIEELSLEMRAVKQLVKEKLSIVKRYRRDRIPQKTKSGEDDYNKTADWYQNYDRPYKYIN